MNIDQRDHTGTYIYAHLLVTTLLAIITCVYFILCRRRLSATLAISSSDVQESRIETLPSPIKHLQVSNNDNVNQSIKDKEIPSGPSFGKTENWRCACDGRFLPPSLLKSFGGMEAAVKLGIGQCYHKNS